MFPHDLRETETGAMKGALSIVVSGAPCPWCYENKATIENCEWTHLEDKKYPIHGPQQHIHGFCEGCGYRWIQPADLPLFGELVRDYLK